MAFASRLLSLLLLPLIFLSGLPPGASAAFASPRHAFDSPACVESAPATLPETGLRLTIFIYSNSGESPSLSHGLYYLRARYMNAANGRFWNADSYEGSQRDPKSLHRYTYCGNDPINCIDPSGHLTLVETMTVTALASITAWAGSSILHNLGYEKSSQRAEGLSRMLAGVSLIAGARLAAPANPRYAYLLATAASDEIVAGGEQLITGSQVPSPLEALGQTLGFSAESAHDFVLSFKVVTSVGPLFYVTALRLQQMARTLLSDLEIAAAESEVAATDLIANPKAIGSPGKSPGVRTVDSLEEMQRLYSKLSQGGENITPVDYDGLMVRLPDGTIVGFRFGSKSGGSTLDITPAGAKPYKVHIND